MTRPLSPAAQAVMDAAMGQDGEPIPVVIAAAIRALADKVAQMRPHGGRAWTTEQSVAYDALSRVADHHAAIATELEGPMAKPLSSAAQAAWEAYNDVMERVGTFEDYGDALGAAFHAVALHLPNDCRVLVAIADELEGQAGD
jgi:hypothetical protein